MSKSDFDRKTLADSYSNVQRVEDGAFDVYRVFDERGNEAGMITCMRGNEVRVYVDNFPSQKKYFTCNYPVPSSAQFEADIARTGLVLVHSNPNPTEK